MSDWTIDACILASIVESGCFDLECAAFLYHHMKNNQYACIDMDETILESYKDHVDLYNPHTMVGRWWKALTRKSLIRYLNPSLTHAETTNLLGEGFDSDDLIYVAIAKSSQDKKIVSVNSDFGCNPKSSRNRLDLKEYIEQIFPISIFPPDEAVNHF